MGFIETSNIITGKDGTAFATINGRNEEMFYLKKIDAKVEKKKKELNFLGERGVKHKSIGWNGKGSMSIYAVTSLFKEVMLKYIKTGEDTYFDVTVVNEDPNSKNGKQTVVLKGVNLDDMPFAFLDVENEALEEEINFTFEDIDMLDKFIG